MMSHLSLVAWGPTPTALRSFRRGSRVERAPRFARRGITMLALAASVAAVNAHTQKSTDVTGKWSMTLEMEVGTATPALELVQKVDKITGTYTGRYGAFAVTGTLKDSTIEFSFTMNADSDPMTMAFRGTVAADGKSMKGTAAMGEMGEAKWSAERSKK